MLAYVNSKMVSRTV
jgi:hypothetical protein